LSIAAPNKILIATFADHQAGNIHEGAEQICVTIFRLNIRQNTIE
jgi:hypothetical protein